MSVLLFIVILLVLIVGHELGHFGVAKWFKMKVLEFGVGFPPKLWGKKIGETEYTINALPFGGFVRIFGEDESEKFEERAFARHSKPKQAAVLFAGPLMNVVIGFIAFWIALTVGVPTAIHTDAVAAGVTNVRVMVATVLPNSPAALVGIAVGDTVVSIVKDGVILPITKPEDIAAALRDRSTPVTVNIERAESHVALTFTPRQGIVTEFPERYGAGVATVLVGTKALGPVAAFFEAFVQTGYGLVAVVKGFAHLIGSVFTFSASLQDVSGPIGIAGLVGDASAIGVGQVLLLTAILSLNLAVLNLLPFPALDGGRLMMLLIESIRGRVIKTSTTQLVNMAGFFALILLMLVVTWNDIAKLFN